MDEASCLNVGVAFCCDDNSGSGERTLPVFAGCQSSQGGLLCQSTSTDEEENSLLMLRQNIMS